MHGSFDNEGAGVFHSTPDTVKVEDPDERPPDPSARSRSRWRHALSCSVRTGAGGRAGRARSSRRRRTTRSRRWSSASRNASWAMPPARSRSCEPLAAGQPGWAPAHYELGMTLGLRGAATPRSQRCGHAVRLKPEHRRRVARARRSPRGDGRREGADAAYAATSRRRPATRACWRLRPRYARTASPWRSHCCAST